MNGKENIFNKGTSKFFFCHHVQYCYWFIFVLPNYSAKNHFYLVYFYFQFDLLGDNCDYLCMTARILWLPLIFLLFIFYSFIVLSLSLFSFMLSILVPLSLLSLSFLVSHSFHFPLSFSLFASLFRSISLSFFLYCLQFLYITRMNKCPHVVSRNIYQVPDKQFGV